MVTPPLANTEAEIQKLVVKQAREMGLLVVVTATDKIKRRQESGCPDLLIWGKDKFLTLELKSSTGKLRQSQIDFYSNVQGYLGKHVVHRVAYSVEQAMVWVEWAAREE